MAYVRKTKHPEQLLVIQELASVKPQIPAFRLNFAKSLVENFNKYGKLSEKQMHFVHKIISEAKNPRPTVPTETVKVDGILAMFAKAGSTLKRPKVALQDTTGQPVVFKLAGTMSKYTGQIMVSDGGPFGQAKFFGRITTDGTYHPTPSTTNEVRELLGRFSANPEKIAAEYGKLTGACCFCTKHLDDERSTEVGYGPVCAKRYGLAWGSK